MLIRCDVYRGKTYFGTYFREFDSVPKAHLEVSSETTLVTVYNEVTLDDLARIASGDLSLAMDKGRAVTHDFNLD